MKAVFGGKNRERCILCGRKISNTKYNFGIGCLKKTCLSMHIDDIKNLNGEAELNRKIRNPKDMEIISGKEINDIKKDDNFKNKINSILNEHENESKINVNGIIRFGNGDLLLALHDATLNVIGEKQINNSWNLQIEITDRYDFTDYKEIQEIIGENIGLLERLGKIANNIAMISASCNVIKEYNISIKFNMDNWKV